jgi:uncharacterized Zn finger protein (UPF0148 family)
MTMTARYCPTCRNKVTAMLPRTDDERQFYWASLRKQGAVVHAGTCDRCGRQDILTYYRLPD